MKKIFFLVFIIPFFSEAQNVGIGTTNPLARLHVTDSNVIFSAPVITSLPTGVGLPISGEGARLMWIPRKAAFRAGNVFGNNWDAENIGAYSFASGYNTRASGTNSTALGVANTSSGYGSLSAGIFSIASGDMSFAMGEEARASGNYSTSLGYFSNARSFNSIAIGRFNDSVASSDPANWIATDPLFTIGNGTDDNARHNAMVLYKNGNLVLKNPTTVTTDPVGFTVPISGAGTRMMWLPEKGALRAGTVIGNEWDGGNIGYASFAAGKNTRAVGEYGFAFGNGARAMGSNSTAIGNIAVATGTGSFATGGGTAAIGNYSFAVGFATSARGFNSAAIGDHSQSSGTYSMAAGEYTVSRPYGSLAVGTYNDSIISSNSNSYVSTDPVFIVGNGTAEAARSNAMVVYKNGNTDINGYTQLGKASEGAPAIKMKKITSTNGAAGVTTAFAHGLTQSKILRADVFINATSGNDIGPLSTYTGFEYDFYVSGTSVVIRNIAGNDTFIAGRPLRILITYEE